LQFIFICKLKRQITNDDLIFSEKDNLTTTNLNRRNYARSSLGWSKKCINFSMETI